MIRNTLFLQRPLSGAATYTDFLRLPDNCRQLTISVVLAAIGGTTPSIVITLEHNEISTPPPVIQTTGALTSATAFYYTIPFPPSIIVVKSVLSGTDPTAQVDLLIEIFSD